MRAIRAPCPEGSGLLLTHKMSIVLLERLKSQIYSNESLVSVQETLDECLYSILDDYNHSHMIAYTRFLEMLRDTGLAEEVERKLKIVDLIKFPIKKSIG
jgi:hypothetical protein